VDGDVILLVGKMIFIRQIWNTRKTCTYRGLIDIFFQPLQLIISGSPRFVG
jgi:hypothetical protein